MKNIIRNAAVSLLIGGLILVISAPAGAWPETIVYDFITGGGWFIQRPGSFSAGYRSNFGWHGGAKNGAWWGNGNYLDHGPISLHAHSIDVTGYLRIGDDTTTDPKHPTGVRDICGHAYVTYAGGSGNFWYRVRMKDAGEPGRDDKFGIALYAISPGGGIGGNVYTAWGQLNGGGNIQLHRGNNSNTGPSTYICPPAVFDDTFFFS
ncbi:MAG: hypothetical protein E6H05_08340 [Bacillati bacterium ANGP1]|uniref:Uncharacterized protein n=1 Tax=Candidatus Segetimicrobium genomatis TaxID=2569760 RepID=A0A537IRN3_9BACT|nr:MAG: hypothetical protein E6H05_08340 [Terrabacteria group bacterium ANGP1]